MLSNDFKINECDKCVYTKNTQSEYVIVCLYVDDMLIIGNNNDVIKATKKMLTSYFDMKDMGVTDVIFVIKIAKTSSGLILSQCHYIEKILKRFNQYDDNPIKTPVDLNLHLAKNNGPTIDQLEYSRIIDSLMCVMNCTRPYIAYAVNKLKMTSRVVGIGKVVLKMTSGKELILIDVLHVPDIFKNLVFGSMLSKNGFKLVFKSDKFVFMKNGMYVGKGYMTNGLFKMNVMTVKRDFNNNKGSTFVYLIESFTLWHDRLGHVNNKTLKKVD